MNSANQVQILDEAGTENIFFFFNLNTIKLVKLKIIYENLQSYFIYITKHFIYIF